MEKNSQLKVKKSYGQHFLIEHSAAIEAARVFHENNPTDRALEIGPGMGALTKHLLPYYPKLKAVEADNDMVTYLAMHFRKVEVLTGDFLNFNLEDIYEGQPFGLVGNFPYNISSQIVFKMLEYKHLVPLLVGMFQREMAERIIATPGGKDYGVISVLTQAYYSGKIIIRLGPEAFNPPPRVDSAVILLTRNPEDRTIVDHELFRQVVKTSFGQRRKMLRNTMKDFLNAEVLKDTFYNRRPETLSVTEFIDLSNFISSNNKNK